MTSPTGEPSPPEIPAPAAPPGSAPAPRKQIDPLIVLLLMFGLLVGCWFLVQRLIQMSRIQDCVMSGRRNCAPIDVDNP